MLFKNKKSSGLNTSNMSPKQLQEKIEKELELLDENIIDTVDLNQNLSAKLSMAEDLLRSTINEADDIRKAIVGVGTEISDLGETLRDAKAGEITKKVYEIMNLTNLLSQKIVDIKLRLNGE